MHSNSLAFELNVAESNDLLLCKCGSQLSRSLFDYRQANDVANWILLVNLYSERIICKLVCLFAIKRSVCNSIHTHISTRNIYVSQHVWWHLHLWLCVCIQCLTRDLYFGLKTANVDWSLSSALVTWSEL